MIAIRKAIYVGMLCCFLCEAANAQGNFILKMDNVTIKQAMDELKEKSGYSFIFSSSDLDTKKRISVSVENEDIGEAVRQILKGQQGLTYEIKEKNIIIHRVIPAQGDGKRKRVTGKILDSNKEPIIGANIFEKGATKNGTISDVNGDFSLEISERGILHVSYIGYLDQDISVNDKGNVQIILKEDVKTLDELIVIGYGTAKKSDLTGSIQRVDANTFKNQNMTQITDMISGSVAGLNATQGTTAAGGGSIEIRGQSSLKASNEPVIVLDGSIFNGSFRDINPSDVESIDILKDASSAAIYGSRAANGVIMVTTHRGKKGKPKINFSTQLGISDLTNHFAPYDAKGYLTLRRDVMRAKDGNQHPSYFYDDPNNLPANVTLENWRNASNNPQADNTQEWLTRLNFFPIEIENYVKGNSIDWQDEVLRTGTKQKYDLSVNGGTDNLSYFWSIEYQNNKGVIKGDDYSTVRTRLNFDFNINSWLNVGINTHFSDRNEDAVSAVLDWAYYLSPYGSMYNEDGTLRWYPSYGTIENPFIDYAGLDKERRVHSLFATMYSNIKLPFGFNYKISFQPYYEFIRDYRFWSSQTFTGGRDHSGGYATRTNYSSYSWMLDNIVTWKKQFGAHLFDVTLLYSAERMKSWNSFAANQSFIPNENLGYSGLQFGTNPAVSSTDTETSGDAVMGRINYTLLNRYLLTASIRRDGYSAFGSKNPRATFPAIALAWKISDEEFFKIPNVYQLKLRASWGKNGNRAVGPYSALAQLGSIIYYNGSETKVGTYSSTMANKSLSWEKTEAFNLGLDLGLFDNRIDLTVDAYLMKTHDLLMDRQLTRITGYRSISSNLGELQNKGLEITLNTVNIDRPNFKWRSNVVFSMNRNKILKLFGDYEEVEENGKTIKREVPDYTNNWFSGKAIDVIWDYKIKGIWQENEKEEAAKYRLEPGDWKAEDVDKNGKYEALIDKQFTGYKQPRYRIGFRNDFEFLKNFTASFFFRAELGHKAAFPQALHRSGSDSYDKMNIWKFPYWTPENPINDYARLTTSINVFGGGLLIYKPRSFVRLQDVSLSYAIPKSILGRFGIESMDIYYSGHNLFYFSKWPAWDPESLMEPMPRTHILGLRISL
ncbi:MAG: TonB-dependent receptor [Phocaeicola sp.]|uniref:TonB-dependent receptor n=1 Tax=Phocaeicola sp. TaxID=2773926 RepID=UPI003F9EF1AD